MRIINATRGTTLAGQARVADHFFTRLKGLLGAPYLPAGTALLIRPCNSVHTFGMRFAIDVIFVDSCQRVTKTVLNMGPGRVALGRGAALVLELPVGAVTESATAVGDYLNIG